MTGDSDNQGASELNLDRFNEMLLESTAVGLAILDPEPLTIVFHNKRFGEWFSNVEDRSTVVTDLFPDIDVGRLRARMDKGRPYTTETKVRLGRREVSIALVVTMPADEDVHHLIVECQNVSKIKELEYMIESYSKMVEKQNRTLQREKERAEKLLLNIMPRKVYEEIESFGVATPQRFESASVLMLDFVDFTEMTIAQDPTGLISELNEIFTAFDFIVERHNCERIKTVGDAYIAVSGVPEAVMDHAQNVARVALLFVRYLKRRNSQHEEQWRCRIGINTGALIGSMVGIQKYVYDIFGPGVNLAARMEALSGPMQITLCDLMHDLIKSDFHFTDRGDVEVKGFGTRRIYTLEEAEDSAPMELPPIPGQG
ncbi:MAG: adenylate/guanylate cyclase domain-containing protein [Gemmatimonadota bacterium]